MSKEDAVLVTFARPEESGAFRRRLEGAQPLRGNGPVCAKGRVGTARVAVAHLGIGPGAAAAVIAELLARDRWSMVIGAGFAGGLDPKLSVGDTVMEEFPPSKRPRIVSVASPLESVAAKRALFAETGALAVDMETEALARACASAGIPLVALRAISDSADTDLPVPFDVWFDLERQRPRPWRLLRHLACHPRKIPAFARFARQIPRVATALAIAVEGCIASTEHA